MIRWASYEGFAGCVASARHAAAVLSGEAQALPREGVARLDGPVVLSSWHPTYERLLESGTAIIPRWHSPLLQTELSDEGWRLARQIELLDSGRVPALVVNHAALVTALGRDRVVVLPDVLDENQVRAAQGDDGPGVAVSLFGEPRGRKNLMAQSAAFALAAGDDWTLHLAGQTRRRAGYGRWLDLLGIEWVDHGFMPRADYLDTVASMDAGLAATLSESYGYVAAEHVLLGVPVVTAPGVTCLPPDELRVADAGDPRQLADALLAAVDGGGVGQRAALLERAGANEVAAHAGVARIRELTGL